MITPLLEKMILRGEANVAHVSHAQGGFGRIPLTQGKLAVITQIVWYPFLNPVNSLANISWFQLLSQFCEYALKIDSSRGVTTIPFRNAVRAVNMSNNQAMDLSALVDPNTDYVYLSLQPGDPIILQTYIPVADYCKITIYRHALSPNGGVLGVPSAAANESNSPAGVGDIAVANNLNMASSWTLSSEIYTPPSPEFASVASADPMRRHPYQQGIYPRDGGTGSLESEIDTDYNLLAPFVSNPLVVFEVVYINNDKADELQSTK